MLKQRIITAVVLAPIVLSGVFLLGIQGFALFFAVVTLLGAWEWARLCGFIAPVQRIVYVGLVFLSLAVCWLGGVVSFSVSALIPAIILWCLCFFWVMKYPSTVGWSDSITRALLGVVLLTSAWLSLLYIKDHESGNAWILLLLLVVWAADIGAYFSGKRWGKTKLAPAVSPGKTREGLYGGVVAVALTSIIFSIWNELSLLASVYLSVMCVIVGVVSVMGDLLESMLKRNAGVKDSGTLLPGHGGVLDRIDSVIAAAPFFFIGLYFLPPM